MFFELTFCLPDPSSKISTLSSEAEEWGHGDVSFRKLINATIFYKGYPYQSNWIFRYIMDRLLENPMEKRG